MSELSGQNGILTFHEPSRYSGPCTALEAKRERAPHDDAGLTPEQLLEIYALLFETRRLEEHLVALYKQNQVIGGVYRSLGQEGTAVGCAYAMHSGDIIQPLIRDLGAMLVHGVAPLALFRQYMARATGPSGGRDLNAHFSAPQLGLLGPISMLGAMVSPLAGCLLASRLRQEQTAGLLFIGDGGSSTGAFYEGLNFAVVQRLPMIVVIEANQYAYSTSMADQIPDGDVVRRALGFGCPVIETDGNDVLACYQATRHARTRARDQIGPTVIVAHTYRRRGHAEHDAQGYVPAGEIETWAEINDPIVRYQTWLTGYPKISKDQLGAVEAKVEAQLQQDRATAVTEPLPTADSLQHGVFADSAPRPWPEPNTWFRGPPAHRQLSA